MASRRIPDGAQAQLAVFGEVNAHLRNTETKQLGIFTAQLAFFGLVLSLLARDDGGLFEPSGSGLVLYGFTAFVGGVLLQLQARYLWHKRRYVLKSRLMASRWDVDPALLPDYLRRPDPNWNPWRSTDRLLRAAATFAELLFALLAIVLLVREADTTWVGAAITVGAAGLLTALVIQTWSDERG